MNDRTKGDLRQLAENIGNGLTPLTDLRADILTDDDASFRRTVILKNIDGIPYGASYALGAAYIDEENKHFICGDIMGEDHAERPFTVTFSDAEERIDVYNAVDCTAFFGDPWDFLCDIAYSIMKKSELDGGLCNLLERDLLPLLDELSLLSPNTYVARLHMLRNIGKDKATESLAFPNMRGLAEKHGSDKISNLLCMLETLPPDSSRYQRSIVKLKELLCEQKNEPMWRELFDKIISSQKEYPNKVETLYPSVPLAELRMSIEERLHERGYAGTYPDFVKKGPIRGIHIEESYGTEYLIGMEKRVVRRIHCIESLVSGSLLRVQFLIGTMLLRPDENEGDIYSCLFNAKGRRIYHTINFSFHDESEDVSPGTVSDLGLCLNIAVKKAELRRLEKNERLAYRGHTGGIGLFLSFFIIAGGMFAAAMMICMVVISSIMTLILVGPDYIVPMFREIPWMPLFLFAWIAFGGGMGLVTVFSKTK